ncbi:hypothetical protein HK096_004820 [Nowakowskiella sp. JEL0078]|nr:hypothetical protein HK096_004820 [Nowakowskiella sp. JEL0078]
MPFLFIYCPKVFVAVLILSQKDSGGLKLKDQTLPGTFILSAHPSCEIQKWAKQMIKQSKNTLDSAQWETLRYYLSGYLDYLCNFIDPKEGDLPETHQFSKKSGDVFGTLELILTRVEEKTRTDIMIQRPQIIVTLVRIMGVSGDFWEIFRCFVHFFRANRELILRNSKLTNDAMTNIINSTTLNSFLCKFKFKCDDETSKAAMTRQLTLCFLFLDYILRAGPSKFGDTWINLVNSVSKKLPTWSEDSRSHFEKTTLLNIQKTKWFSENKDESVKALLNSLLSNPGKLVVSAVGSTIQSSLSPFSIEDLETLNRQLPTTLSIIEKIYNKIFNESANYIRLDKPELNSIVSLWKGLTRKSFGVHTISVCDVALRSYAKILHFEYFTLEKIREIPRYTTSVDDIKYCNGALEIIGTTVLNLLNSVIGKESDLLNIVGVDFLHLLVSKNQKIVEQADRILQAGTKTIV